MWGALPENAPVIAITSCGKALQLHFAGYDDVYVYTYPNGQTKWSYDNVTPLFAWHHDEVAYGL